MDGVCVYVCIGDGIGCPNIASISWLVSHVGDCLVFCVKGAVESIDSIVDATLLLAVLLDDEVLDKSVEDSDDKCRSKST